MSKYKNINLIPYKENGNSIFLIINQDGKREQYFDFFTKNLIQRRFTKNTIQSYSYGIATFIDYIIEYTQYLNETKTLVDGYQLRDIIANFPLLLSGAINSCNTNIKAVAERLNAKPLSSATEESYVAATNHYLLLSEEFRIRLFELDEGDTDYVLVDEQKLFPWIGTKKELSKEEKFQINSKNVLSSVISGGLKFKQMAAITATKRSREKPINDDKEFPIESVFNLIDKATSVLDKTLLSLLAASGLRTSEALLLTLDDIDIENKSIKVVDPKTRHINDYNCYFSIEEKNELPFKTRSTEDVFLIKPFDDLFWKYLTEYLSKDRKLTSKHNLLFTNKDNSDPLIVNGTKSFIQRFRYLSKKQIGSNYSPHSLRHMYISYLVNYFPMGGDRFGLPAAQAQKLVGHSSLNSTQKYIHPDIEMHQLQQKAFFDKNKTLDINKIKGLLK
jgi:integrase/recombinase XerD